MTANINTKSGILQGLFICRTSELNPRITETPQSLKLILIKGSIMSESWKNRLWSLLLVCTFAVVLSVCNKAVNSTSNGSSSSGTAFADGSTVTISSLPNVSVSSAPIPSISEMIYCSAHAALDNGFSSCVASKNGMLNSSGAITLVDLVARGFYPCSTSGSYDNYYRGHFFFCK